MENESENLNVGMEMIFSADISKIKQTETFVCGRIHIILIKTQLTFLLLIKISMVLRNSHRFQYDLGEISRI